MLCSSYGVCCVMPCRTAGLAPAPMGWSGTVVGEASSCEEQPRCRCRDRTAKLTPCRLGISGYQPLPQPVAVDPGNWSPESYIMRRVPDASCYLFLPDACIHCGALCWRRAARHLRCDTWHSHNFMRWSPGFCLCPTHQYPSPGAETSCRWAQRPTVMTPQRLSAVATTPATAIAHMPAGAPTMARTTAASTATATATGTGTVTLPAKPQSVPRQSLAWAKAPAPTACSSGPSAQRWMLACGAVGRAAQRQYTGCCDRSGPVTYACSPWLFLACITAVLEGQVRAADLRVRCTVLCRTVLGCTIPRYTTWYMVAAGWFCDAYK